MSFKRIIAIWNNEIIEEFPVPILVDKSLKIKYNLD